MNVGDLKIVLDQYEDHEEALVSLGGGDVRTVRGIREAKIFKDGSKIQNHNEFVVFSKDDYRTAAVILA